MTVTPKLRTVPTFLCWRCESNTRAQLTPRFRSFATSPPVPSNTGTTPAKYAQLTNRTLIRLAGPDAAIFLHNLVPAKILDRGGRSPIYTAFLSAHGRILNDVFIYPPSEADGQEWFVEADAKSAGDLLKHLRKHKLRSKFQLEKVDPEKLGVYYTWPGDSDLVQGSDVVERLVAGGQDPRPGMGSRWLDRTGSMGELSRRLEDRGVQQATVQDYTVHRMLNGLAEGQTELPSAGSLPQESNIDLFGGIDFFKGCYVGQELTIRTHHTGVVRKRILPCQLYDPGDESLSSSPGQTRPEYNPDATITLPPPQSNIAKAHARGRGRSSGKWLDGIGNIGLALCRLEMMTDIQLTADRTNYDPNEKYRVQWEIEGQDGPREVMLKPFVPAWLREGVEQSLRRKEKKQKPRQEEDEYDEVD
ncbi:ccr4 associated factor [Exophiala dermatitidis]|uniref:Iron-sulfur cluster assembly factor IBA57 homolog, mitochondrial n=1 Tax=Exophiala dermatitidis TaxID=5970 RepID=A0AAN6ER47_EXODE|nr:ccr4 associated factor [Exophiala dermatitidis]KAJ4512322.1 ccr4 associated factor [Exophiala dermatitidis]KAJ4512800.1 ccr4 associated factor [Exophiala dermatitidis]KAJ4542609.1 ccr4 associated factor [Exophiala dermatitidis]KAJ4548299.1 ccr4 associated factor [Exophiala dermatitidis]